MIILPVQIGLAVYKTRVILKSEVAYSARKPGYLVHFQFKWVLIIGICIMVFIIAGALQNLLLGNGNLPASVIYNLVMLTTGGLTGFYGLKQDNLLNQVSGLKSNLTINENQHSMDSGENNYHSMQNTIPDSEAQAVIQSIELVMKNKKPFLGKHFSLEDLAQLINEKLKTVSLVINEVMGKNFYSLVNEYRIKEAIQIMKADKKNLTMDAISDMVGFHSRSTFYTCFKKYTGQTPREFLLSQKKG